MGDDAGTPETFEINGTMAAGNQVRINRERDAVVGWKKRMWVDGHWEYEWVWNGWRWVKDYDWVDGHWDAVEITESEHIKMEVSFDERLRTGDIKLPGLPYGPNRIFQGTDWGIVSWGELPAAQYSSEGQGDDFIFEVD